MAVVYLLGGYLLCSTGAAKIRGLPVYLGVHFLVRSSGVCLVNQSVHGYRTDGPFSSASRVLRPASG